MEMLSFESVSHKRLKILELMCWWTKVCHMVALCDLCPDTFNPEIPFCSVSPEQMQILDWYLWG
jgi:hypothetical protein